MVITEPYAVRSGVFQDLWEMGYRVSPFMNWGAAESILVNPQTGLISGGSDRVRGACAKRSARPTAKPVL